MRSRALATELITRLISKRRGSPNLPGWLVLADTLVDDLTQQAILGAGQKLDLGDKLRSDPMHPREDQRRSERRAVNEHSASYSPLHLIEPAAGVFDLWGRPQEGNGTAEV